MSETTTTDAGVDAGKTSDGDATFDAAAFASDYGVTETVIADAASEEEARQKIQDYADKILSAGVSAPPFQKGVSTADKIAANDKKVADSKGDDDANVTAAQVRKEFREYLAQQQADAEKAEEDWLTNAYAEVDRQVEAEIDSWESETFGQAGKRKFQQSEQADKLKARVKTYMTGLIHTGETVGSVAAIARQVRPFVDSTPPAAKGEDKKAAPLGTPGGTTQSGGEQKFRNIHEAYAASRR